jgi:hypothetical protein
MSRFIQHTCIPALCRLAAWIESEQCRFRYIDTQAGTVRRCRRTGYQRTGTVLCDEHNQQRARDHQAYHHWDIDYFEEARLRQLYHVTYGFPSFFVDRSNMGAWEQGIYGMDEGHYYRMLQCLDSHSDTLEFQRVSNSFSSSHSREEAIEIFRRHDCDIDTVARKMKQYEWLEYEPLSFTRWRQFLEDATDELESDQRRARERFDYTMFTLAAPVVSSKKLCF